MLSSIMTVGEVLNSRKFYIPIFQRAYEWSTQDVARLFRSIDKSSNGVKSQFIGNMVFRDTAVIDGQQRLISLIIALIALGDTHYVGSIAVHNQDSKDWELFISGEDCETRMYHNMQSLKMLCEASDRGTESLLSGLKALKVCVIELSEDDDAQAVLDSLNGTGKSLSDVDLIRNLDLMACGSEDEQANAYDMSWRLLDETSGTLGIERLELLTRFFLQTRRLQSRSAIQEHRLLDFYDMEKPIYGELHAYCEGLLKASSVELPWQMKAMIDNLHWIGAPELESVITSIMLNVGNGELGLEDAGVIIQYIVAFMMHIFITGIEESEAYSRIESAFQRFSFGGDIKSELQKLAYLLFYDEQFGTDFIDMFEQSIAESKTYSLRVIEFFLRNVEIKMSRKEVDFKNVDVLRFSDEYKGFQLSGDSTNDIGYYSKYERLLADYIIVDSDSAYADCNGFISALGASRFAVTRGMKRAFNSGEEGIKKRFELISSAALHIFAVPKMDMATKVSMSSPSRWYDVSEIRSCRGLKAAGLKIQDTEYSGDVFRAIAKTWRAAGCLAILLVLKQSGVLSSQKNIKSFIRSCTDKLVIDDEPMFTFSSGTKPKNSLLIGDSLYCKMSGSGDKILKQLDMVQTYLGIEGEDKRILFQFSKS